MKRGKGFSHGMADKPESIFRPASFHEEFFHFNTHIKYFPVIKVIAFD